MRKKFIITVVSVIIIGLLGGVGTYAWWTSSLQSQNNLFDAGNLELSADNDTKPMPLFTTEYADTTYADWNVGKWYPGKEVKGDNRQFDIDNAGDIPVRVAGVSAIMTEFVKDAVPYTFDQIQEFKGKIASSDPTITDAQREVVVAFDEFTNKLNIRVLNEGATTNTCYYGSLASLLAGPKELKYTVNGVEKRIDLMQPTSSAHLNFEADLSQSANNYTKNVSATVNIIVHGTQVDDNAQLN